MLGLTTWVLRQSVEQCARLRREGLDVTLSLNMRSRSLYSASLVELITTVLSEYSLPLSAVELDVPEAILVAEPTRTIRAMRTLRGAGISVNLDDVGAEFGAVSAVATAPINRTKIDRRLTGDTADPAMTEAIVGLVRVAHQRNLEVVALGVDTSDQWRRLVDLGCDAGRGDAICPPLPASELTAWLSGVMPVSGAARTDPR
jgi:EAL domain-containing protein (putative c-di-GMP-specific phosphodiesterase class I)